MKSIMITSLFLLSFSSFSSEAEFTTLMSSFVSSEKVIQNDDGSKTFINPLFGNKHFSALSNRKTVCTMLNGFIDALALSTETADLQKQEAMWAISGQAKEAFLVPGEKYLSRLTCVNQEEQ